MGKIISVKARIHHGSKSLDLTIPSHIRQEYNIQEGSVFKLIIKKEGRELVLEYHKMDCEE